ncbi:MAG: dihydroorotate dehydrogenase [Gemmatimonadota bacterium]
MSNERNEASSGERAAPDLTRRAFGVEFQSPVLLASGTCGYGREYADLLPLDDLGGLVTKAVSVEPRPGNPPHRVSETPGGMLNAIGLENPGVEAVAREKLPWLAEHLRRGHVFVNVVGRSVDEFARVVARLDGEPGFLGFEVNVSCPNVRGGTLFGTDEEALARLVRRLREETERPLVVKLTPNVPDVGGYAALCEECGADGLSTINTFPGMLIDVERRRPVIGNVSGGVSGPAILPMGVYLTWRAARSCSLPILGVGGIRSGTDAVQYFLAGATLVQVGTASFVDPLAAVKVQFGISAYLERHGLSGVGELVGAVEIPVFDARTEREREEAAPAAG